MISKAEFSQPIPSFLPLLSLLEERVSPLLRPLLPLNFFNVYLFLRETHSASGGWERERETWNLKQAPGPELSAQSPMQGSNS